jgi:hypothetical protein
MKMPLLALALAASVAAFAQPASGPGPGPGMMKGGPRFGADVTPGWAMMTSEERRAHQEKMRGMKDRAACEAYMTEHHKLMEARAKEKGKALPWKGPGRGCDYLGK